MSLQPVDVQRIFSIDPDLAARCGRPGGAERQAAPAGYFFARRPITGRKNLDSTRAEVNRVRRAPFSGQAGVSAGACRGPQRALAAALWRRPFFAKFLRLYLQHGGVQ